MDTFTLVLTGTDGSERFVGVFIIAVLNHAELTVVAFNDVVIIVAHELEVPQDGVGAVFGQTAVVFAIGADPTGHALNAFSIFSIDLTVMTRHFFAVQADGTAVIERITANIAATRHTGSRAIRAVFDAGANHTLVGLRDRVIVARNDDISVANGLSVFDLHRRTIGFRVFAGIFDARFVVAVANFVGAVHITLGPFAILALRHLGRTVSVCFTFRIAVFAFVGFTGISVTFAARTLHFFKLPGARIAGHSHAVCAFIRIGRAFTSCAGIRIHANQAVSTGRFTLDRRVHVTADNGVSQAIGLPLETSAFRPLNTPVPNRIVFARRDRCNGQSHKDHKSCISHIQTSL